MRNYFAVATAPFLNTLFRIPSFILLGVVVAYRRFVSPYKARRCAHAALYGRGHSCSDVGLRTFRRLPIWQAAQAMRKQFDACGRAKTKLADRKGQLDVECCELILEPKELMRWLSVGDRLAWFYGSLAALKYILAGSYYFDSPSQVYGFLYGWLAPNLIGAAASSLWPVVLLTLFIDFKIVKGLLGKGDAHGLALVQIGLGLLVVWVEPWLVAGVLDGGSGVFQLFLSETGKGQLARHLRVISGLHTFPLALAWAAYYLPLFILNPIDNWSKD